VLGVVFDVPKGHHITDVDNGLFFVETMDTLGLAFDSAVFPKGIKYKGDRAYKGKVLVKVPVSASSDAVSGKYILPLKVGYQICQEFGQEICYLPMDMDIMVSTEIVAAGSKVTSQNDDIFKAAAVAVGETSDDEAPRSLDQRLMDALDKGSWLAFLLVFVGGVLASLTPCVYPIIPITIGYIGGASQGKPMRGLWLSFVFSLGIAVVYSSLGLISAATGSLFGSFSGSPVVTLGIALIFVFMGFSMLGAFDIAIPAALQSRLQGGGKARGFLGPLLMGMASGLVMAPCVGPVIVALLAWVAKSGNLFYGWALLFVFSMGIGLLFLFIGTFSGAIQALPRAGGWMEKVKTGFGWILLAAALYLVRLMIPPQIMAAAWGVLLVMFSVFSGAFDSLTEDSESGKRVWKGITLIVFLVGAIFLFKAFGPGQFAGRIAEKEGVVWQVNKEEEALNEARDQSKPMIVDVYADWCVACVELDEKTYVIPDVVQRLDNFVRLKLDFTRKTPWVEEMKRKYKITGMPTVILFDGTGEEVTRFTGFLPAKKFLSLLDQNNL
jgi:thiol:disulfide interchange protein DsbD